MNSILRIALVFTFVVCLCGTFVSKTLWASSCCGSSGGSDHSSHESGGHATQTKAELNSEKAATVKDPVCGMEINNIKKAPSEKYKGKVYYFCSKKCEKVFKKGPAPYTCGCATMMKDCDCGHCKGKEETCPCPLEHEGGKPHEHTEGERHKEGETYQHN